MKIYLDNNLGVEKVEQEELTQDTYGYNILKVYIPNAVLTPYDTFTCYYGALLQNGRKVGWFAMEARTSSDADYEENYTLYKATLEQCVVSVEGKVYIGCQVLLGNSGNATLIKKNTAVVQFNVRKSVAINNDILVLDPDQTNTDVLESYKNLLENALLTYVTKASIADNLTTNDSSKVLSAKQGKVLKAMLDALDDSKADKSDTYTKTEVDTLLVPKVAHEGNQLTDSEGNDIYPNLEDRQVGGVKINPDTSKEEVTNFSDYVTIETNVRYLNMDSNNMPIAQANTSYSTAFIDKSAFSGNIELHLASASGVPIFFINSIGKVVNIFTSNQIKSNTTPFTYNSEDSTFTIDINWLNSVPSISKVLYSMNNDNFYVGDTSFKQVLNWLKIKYDNYAKKSIKLDCLDEDLYLPKLIIPDVLYASVGNEFCIYKDDIFDCSNGAMLEKFDLYWLTYDLSNNYALYDKVKTYDTHMSLVPTVSEIGEYKLKIQLKLNNVEVLSKVIRLIISNNIISSKTCIFIGDSFTASGIFPDKLLSLCDGGMTQLDRIGLSGWNTNMYLNREENNPFYNNGFDFSYYMNSKGFASVDYVFINLGTNDITQTQNLTNTVANLNTIIESIHYFNSNIKIFVGIPTTPPKTQTSWYNQYNNVTVKMMRYRCFDLAKKMLEGISGTNIILVPLYITLDTVYDFPHSQMAVSYTNPELIDYISDPIHPNTYGYYKIANIIYSFLINLG